MRTHTKKPLISIIIPLFNKEKEVKRAIESVLHQTFSNFELIIINDGSTDKSSEIVQQFADSRIRLIHQGNGGVSAARNRGIRESHSEFIAFLDADDEWKPSFLETILELKERYTSCQVFATNYLYCDKDGTYRRPIIKGIPPHPWQGVIHDYFSIACQSDPLLCSSSVAMQKEAIESVRLFPEGIASGEDLLTWAKLALRYNIAYSSIIGSVFYTPREALDRPRRFIRSDDAVGKELIRLQGKVKPSIRKSFRKYIAMWYKNRAVTFLELGENKIARQELEKLAVFSDKSLKWWLYKVLALFPGKITRYLVRQIKELMKFRRKSLPGSV